MEPYFIARDKYGYILTERTKNNNVAIGHYTNLGGCLKGLAKCIGNYKKNYSSIKEYLEDWNKQEKRIENLTKNLTV
jgi:hypothetical protein